MDVIPGLSDHLCLRTVDWCSMIPLLLLPQLLLKDFRTHRTEAGWLA